MLAAYQRTIVVSVLAKFADALRVFMPVFMPIFIGELSIFPGDGGDGGGGGDGGDSGAGGVSGSSGPS